MVKCNTSITIDPYILAKSKEIIGQRNFSNYIENVLRDRINTESNHEDLDVAVLEKKKTIFEKEQLKIRNELKTIDKKLTDFKDQEEKKKLEYLEFESKRLKEITHCAVCGLVIENSGIKCDKGFVHINCYSIKICGQVFK